MADGIKELRLLYLQLSRLKGPLRDLSSMPENEKDDTMKDMEKKITKELSDVEDIIDSCFTTIAVRKGSKFRLPPRSPISTLAETVKQIMKDKIPQLNIFERYIASLDLAHDTKVTKAKENYRTKKSRQIVGFEDEANTVIRFLTTESNKLETITIFGLAGVGKTTLAWKIFKDPILQFEFPIMIWVKISDDLNMKNVLLTILKNFPPYDVPDVPIHELVKIVKSHLEVEKFLIVMDDICTTRVWNDIEDFLPMNNKLGRILITSRDKDVAMHSNPTREPHQLRFLTERESWELLQYEVFDTIMTVPSEIKKVGLSIAKKCNGLPLAIVVIGDILRGKISSTRSFSSLEIWLEVFNSMSYQVLEDKTKALDAIISLSYKTLPYELRNCFLYLAMFPKDTDIPVKKIVRLWIAEGFIQETNGMNLEETAHENVKILINKSFLIVKAEKPNGEPKKCCLHDIVHEFCKKEAASQNVNLFQEIYKSDQGVFEPSDETREKCRRLCIHSDVLDFFKENPALPKVRSFLCFHEYEIDLDASHISLVTDCFRLLRVYDAGTIKFPKLPPKILQLVHLRYLTLVIASECSILPASISELWNLQTLILDTPSHTLEIDADIWMLRQLRHVKTKASIILKNLDGKGEGGKNLQTLSRLSPESCTEKVFAKAKNLVTLGIQGELSNQFVESRNFNKLLLLNKLTLVHRVARGVTTEKPMPNLPEQNRFPPNLKILVLIDTLLDWDKLFVLTRLSHLEELKLKKNACKGDTWEVDRGFKHLELLRIEMVPELKYWKVNGDAFPELRFLLISNCENLLEVPIVLGKKLELLYMEGVTTPNAVSCAEEIRKEKEAGARGGGFKLLIASNQARATQFSEIPAPAIVKESVDLFHTCGGCFAFKCCTHM